MTVAEVGEHALLARLLARLPRPSAAVLVGPGDDAAVLAPGRNERLVVTTDAVVEGVHFSRAFSTPADIGHKALAVNLSDLAAMAATPRWALLSLVLPGSWLVADVEDLVDGLSALAAARRVGGRRKHHAHRWPTGRGCDGGWRSRAAALVDAGRGSPGHDIYVSGTIGGAAAGLEMLRQGSGIERCLCREASTTGAASAAGCGDGSRTRGARGDGFERRAGRRGAAGGRGESRRSADRRRRVTDRRVRSVVVDPRGIDPVIAAIAGGDDYELLLAMPPRGRARSDRSGGTWSDPPLTKIGVFTKDPREMVIVRSGKEDALPEGFEHFANR